MEMGGIGARKKATFKDVAGTEDEAKEVKRIVNAAYEEPRGLLSGNRDVLERIAQALLEREVIDALK